MGNLGVIRLFNTSCLLLMITLGSDWFFHVNTGLPLDGAYTSLITSFGRWKQVELGGSVKIMSLRVVVKIITMRAVTDRRWVRTKQTEMGIMETNDPRVALNHSFESGTKLMSSILNTNP